MTNESQTRTEALYTAMAQQVMPLWLGVPTNEIFAALFELMIQSVMGSRQNLDRDQALALVMNMMNEVATHWLG